MCVQTIGICSLVNAKLTGDKQPLKYTVSCPSASAIINRYKNMYLAVLHWPVSVVPASIKAVLQLQEDDAAD